MPALEFISEIRLKENGQVFFIDQENQVVEALCNQYVMRRQYVPSGEGFQMGYSLEFYFPNDPQGFSFTVDIRYLTLVEISPGNFRTFTDLGDEAPVPDLQEKFNDVYPYLAEYIFKCCCCDGNEPSPFPYPSNTWAVWLDTLNNDLLPKGKWIEVTEIPSQPGAIFSLFCTETNQIALGGFGQFLNADWQNVGDYSGVEDLTSVAPEGNLGQWNSAAVYSAFYAFITTTGLSGGTFSPGDTVTDTTTGATGEILSCTTNTMYIIYTSSGLTFDPTNTIDNGTGVTATIDTVTAGPITGNIVIWNGLHYQCTDMTAIDGNDPATNTTAYTLLPITDANMGYILEQDIIEFDFVPDWLQYRADNLGNAYRYSKSVDTIFFGLGSTGINRFQWGRNVWIDNKVENGLINQLNFLGTITDNNLLSQATISGNTADSSAGTIANNTIAERGGISSNTLTGSGAISNLTIGSSAVVANKTISSNYASGTVNISSVFTENIVDNTGFVRQPGLDTESRDVDITGLTTLDLSTVETVGIYNLTGASATLDIVLNYPTQFPFTLRPAAGIVATITITPVSLAGDGNIIGPSAFAILDGDKGDEITLSPVTLGIDDVLKQINLVQNI